MNLLEQMKCQPPNQKMRRGSGRQVFMGLRNEIAQALADGYQTKEVWKFLYDNGSMPIQYRTFNEYVNRYIKRQNKKDLVIEKKAEQQNTKNENTNEQTMNEPLQTSERKIKRFEYSAIPRDDLI